MFRIGIVFVMLLTILSCGEDYSIEYDNVPRNLSWADIDLDGDGVGENYITGIKKQPCVDCFIYAAIGLYETQYQIDHRQLSSLDLSEQNIHNCLGIPCNGFGSEVWMLEYIKKYGIIEEVYSPTGRWGTCEVCKQSINSPIGPISPKSIPYYSFSDFTTVVPIGMPYEDKKIAMVVALQTGPLIMDLSSWRGIRNNNGTLYCYEKKLSGHAIMVVGYLDYGKMFLLKNSHGGNMIYKFIFEGADKCGFAHRVSKINSGSTYVTWGRGPNDICTSQVDYDGDGIFSINDNCPYTSNVDQKNTDGDMFGDVCDRCPNDFNATTGFYCK